MAKKKRNLSSENPADWDDLQREFHFRIRERTEALKERCGPYYRTPETYEEYFEVSKKRSEIDRELARGRLSRWLRGLRRSQPA